MFLVVIAFGSLQPVFYWIGDSWIGAGFTLVYLGLDLKLLWIGLELSGTSGASKHMAHPVIARGLKAEHVGTILYLNIAPFLLPSVL